MSKGELPNQNQFYQRSLGEIAEYSKVFFGIVRLPNDESVIILKGNPANPAELVNTVCSHLQQDLELRAFLCECIELVKEN